MDFENKDRLLSDDEKELIRVLSSFHDAIEELRTRQRAIEDLVEALTKAFGTQLLEGKKH